MDEVSRVLAAMGEGDLRASEELLPLVYDELRRLAVHRLAREKPGQTLQPTALVHEAYLRVAGGDAGRRWNGRGHFFAAVGEAMRRILVEQARRRSAAKRGGGLGREGLDGAEIAAPEPDEQLLAVHEGLDELARADPEAALVVKLRFFGGMTMAEVADAMGISVRSAHDLWAYARTWLHRRIGSG